MLQSSVRAAVYFQHIQLFWNFAFHFLELIEKVSYNRLPVDSGWIGGWEQVEVQCLLSRAGFHNLRIWTSEPIEHVTDKKMNKIVEITLLCGSSIFVPNQSVFSFPICMLRCRFLRMSPISVRSLSLTPDWWSFFRSPFIQTESKAFSNSMEITAPFVCFFWLLGSIISVGTITWQWSDVIGSLLAGRVSL